MELLFTWKREFETAFRIPPAVPFAGLKVNDGVDLGRKDFAFGLVMSASLVSCRKIASGFIDINSVRTSSHFRWSPSPRTFQLQKLKDVVNMINRSGTRVK
jgi:hypothetical protein